MERRKLRRLVRRCLLVGRYDAAYRLLTREVKQAEENFEAVRNEVAPLEHSLSRVDEEHGKILDELRKQRQAAEQLGERVEVKIGGVDIKHGGFTRSTRGMRLYVQIECEIMPAKDRVVNARSLCGYLAHKVFRKSGQDRFKALRDKLGYSPGLISQFFAPKEVDTLRQIDEDYSAAGL